MNPFLIFALIGVSIFLVTSFYDWAWSRGYRQGKAESTEAAHEQGRMEADNFWVRAEESVEEARKAIWKEEESA